MKTLNTLFLIALLYVNPSISVKLGSSTQEEVANRIYITVDNILDSITIDGKTIDLNGVTGTRDWTQTSTINVPFDIKEGDKIEISGTNSGAYSRSNPASIIATIFYKNKYGDVLKLNTNSLWTCDNQAPLVYGNNGVSPWGTRPYIDSLAQHIWNIDPAQEKSTCAINVPKSKNGIMYVTADNIITEITIGTEKIDLTKAVGFDNWTVTKSYSFDINDGDLISISAVNSGPYSSGNPASIIATIIYRNKTGEKVIINTNESWSCDGSEANVLGNNGVGPWGNRPNIDSQAKHIWNQNAANPTSTCSNKTIAPKSAKLFITVDNVITDITIAGVKVDLTKATGIDQWTLTKSYDVEFKDGDLISITGRNVGTYNRNTNPGSILATIKYSINGVSKELNTNGEWTCNNKPAALLGLNGSAPAPWGLRPLVSVNSNHIWSQDLTEAIVTCTFKLIDSECLKKE